ncbi:uncharacterized protein LOC111400972 [Olea europaea var. sylvestris]|uniref:uncharacterized protein LOC111400972 n=1 Tax=Olea europaea var. sylvestris TaxID=158386 RepID=UPI000C1D0209|nr:uncharacterized protein LOC111400972 [Olea europaea var. sylvestris]
MVVDAASKNHKRETYGAVYVLKQHIEDCSYEDNLYVKRNCGHCSCLYSLRAAEDIKMCLVSIYIFYLQEIKLLFIDVPDQAQTAFNIHHRPRDTCYLAKKNMLVMCNLTLMV